MEIAGSPKFVWSGSARRFPRLLILPQLNRKTKQKNHISSFITLERDHGNSFVFTENTVCRQLDLLRLLVNGNTVFLGYRQSSKYLEH
jgi:hypothetical protein